MNQANKNELPSVNERARIGLVASDPLRILGLQAIFSEGLGVEVKSVSLPGALEDESLPIVMIDAEYTDHLFELLAAFRRRRPDLRLIIFGTDADPAFTERVIGAGAKGYLVQSASESELRLAYSVVMEGSVWAPRKVLARLLENSTAQKFAVARKTEPAFTTRENEVLNLLVAGRPNREIAGELGVHEGTVKAHIGRIMRKVGVRNRTALTMYTLQKKVLATDGWFTEE